MAKKAVKIETIEDKLLRHKYNHRQAAEELGVTPMKFSRWKKAGVVFLDGKAYRPVI